MKTDIKKKLTSRKFLMAVAGIITGIVMISNGNVTEGSATIITAIVAYLAAEGYIDAKSVQSTAQSVADKLENSIEESEESELT